MAPRTSSTLAAFEGVRVPSKVVPFLQTAFTYTPDFIPLNFLSWFVKLGLLSGLGFVLWELHCTSLDEIDITSLLSWRDVCQEVEKLGCRVSPLLAWIRKIVCVLFKKHRKFVRTTTLDIQIVELESKLDALRKQKVDSCVSLPAECMAISKRFERLKILTMACLFGDVQVAALPR